MINMKLKLNKKAPSFKLPSTSGDIFEISKIKKNIILYIYPKDTLTLCMHAQVYIIYKLTVYIYILMKRNN